MSSVYEGLLAAVIAEPDSDLPRLVMADWYDENGEPERAEFIRVQIELARGVRGKARRAAMEARAAELLTEHGGRWREPLASLGVSDYGVQFRRGFVYGVELDDVDDDFALRAPDLFAAAPIQRIAFAHAYSHAGRAGCPELLRLRELGLDRAGYEDDELAALFASPYLRNLVRLEMPADDDNGHLSAGGLRLLSECPNLPALRELDLSGNWCEWGLGLHEGWVASLLAGGLAGQLSWLSLSMTMMDDAAAAVLASSPHLARLERLDLSNNYIVEDGCRALAESPHLSALRLLDLRKNIHSEEPREMHIASRRLLRRRFGRRVKLDGDE